MGPLAGFRIIEMAGIGPAPFAATLLSDMGAEVIRIDRREAADLGLPGREPKFDVLHRGRRSLAIDLKSEAGCAVVKRLAAKSDGLIEGLFAGLEPLPEMLEAVRAVRAAGVLTGLVSNSWVMEHYDARLRALFDAVVISGEVGLHKPQPEIFVMAAERLGVTPERCVFVDDLRENCAGAEAVGMAAVLHRDPAQTIARLEELLGLELAAGT